MKFITKKEDILNELQILQGIVEKRNTMPILANILINASQDKVELIGTDLEVGMKTHFSAEVEETGAVTVSGKKVFEIAKSLSSRDDVSFEKIDEKMMRITSGASEFKVNILPKEDYPQVPEPKFEKDINLPLEKFKEMIERVYCAISHEQRYYLNGALMKLKNNSIELISTDGHRLAYTCSKIEDLNITEEIKGIISKKTLSELRKFEDKTIAFDLDENNLFFNITNRTITSRIIEGKFPNYEAVIPKDNSNTLTLSREKISNAVSRVSLLSSERSRGVRFSIKGNKVSLFSSNPELGEARDEVEVEYSGDELEIGFNSQYILDFLSTVKAEEVCFELKDENSAVLMRTKEEEEIEYKYVLMPMKI
jgi:DNA polymerase-3 subunit beta